MNALHPLRNSISVEEPMKNGDRVLALSHTDAKRAYVFGAGIYDGKEVPPEGCGGEVGEYLREAGVANPKIVLDSGKVVYGCECWWGPEDVVRKRIAEREVVELDIDAERKKTLTACTDNGDPSAPPNVGDK